MPRRIRLTDEARKDLFDIWFYISRDNIQAADRTIYSIKRRMRVLSTSPHIGTPRQEVNLQSRSLAIGNFYIFYRIKKNDVEVLRILHQSRQIKPPVVN